MAHPASYPVSGEVKRQGREADHSPSSAAVKNVGAIPMLPHTSWCGAASLIKPRDNFTLPFPSNMHIGY
jgi:hypothetical protein